MTKDDVQMFPPEAGELSGNLIVNLVWLQQRTNFTTSPQQMAPHWQPSSPQIFISQSVSE